MRIHDLHSWDDLTPAEAVDLQRRLAPRVSAAGTRGPGAVRTVAGVDLSPPDPETGLVRGAAVVLSLPDREVVEVAVADGVPGFPYVPGLLSFREAPVLARALGRLRRDPDLIMVDGQGLAHPRRFGLACHLGLMTGVPTIGCAKSRLVGAHEAPAAERGSWTPLVHRGERIGAALRTRSGVSPVFVSVGHRISLESAVHWSLACASKYRVPDPTRMAHAAAAGRDPSRIRR